jgi:uncharacterized membrane protein YkvA (DUF1232 family)
MTWGQMALGVVGSLVAIYLIMVALLGLACSRRPDRATLREAAGLLPQVIGLVRRLASDPGLPRGVRTRLVLLFAYLISPVDLVPDVVPVLGHLDDAVLTAIVLRSTVRRAGPEAVERHWRGSPQGLDVVRRLAGL